MLAYAMGKSTVNDLMIRKIVFKVMLIDVKILGNRKRVMFSRRKLVLSAVVVFFIIRANVKNKISEMQQFGKKNYNL